jgi:hypothetical protein
VERKAPPAAGLPARSATVEIPQAPDTQHLHVSEEDQLWERKLKRPSGRTRPDVRKEGRPQPPSSPEQSTGRSPEFVSKMEAWAEQTEEAERGFNHMVIPKTTPVEPVIRGSDEDFDMDDAEVEGDYVYDTYIRHPVSPNTTIETTASIGHLVISEEDEELWQTYIDDDADDKEFDTDEEDSNGQYLVPRANDLVTS